MRFDLIRLDEQRYVFIQHSHHILLDGWCLPIMLNEVLDSYLAFKRGQTPQLPSVRPYRDYIAWLQQQDTAIAGQYWQQRLAGFITPTPLVIVNHKTATPVYHEVSYALTLATTSQLHHFSQSQRITLNTLIQSVWVLLLSGYSRETDICFGVTVSGRNAPLSGIEHMMGLFINTLPLRIQINPEDSVNHFLQQVQKQHQEDNLYAYSPLFEIQAASDMANGTGLFDSLLVFENYPLDSTLSADASAYQIEDVQDIESTNYPLTIAVIPSATLLFKISYDQQRISSNSIERLWGHLNTLLTTIIANPQQAIGCLSLLTAGEIQQLQAWNHTEITYPPANSIVDLFEQQAEKTPENIAVVFAQQALTYRQLNEKANQWAHYLLSLRTPEGTALLAHNPLIAIAVDRSLEMMIGLLAILKAGSAYLPIDPDYPATRLRYLLEDSRAPLLLTQSHYADIVALTVTYECVVLALDSTDVTPQASQNPCVNTGAQNLAYVIYTSGSTGQPKGVLVEQGNLLNSTLARQDYYQSNGATRLLLLPSFAFDAFGAGAFLTLSNGGSLYLPQNPSDINQLVSIIDAQKISHFVCTPTLYQELLRQMDKPLESLRGIIFGGEVSSHTLLKQHFTKMTQAGLFNEYGPTEATIWTTVFRYQTPHQAGNVIGRPIANTRIYLLNTRQQPQPLGIAGELCIAGLGLARGYLNQAELTSEKFLEVELFGQHERIYRTGDLARWLPDGNLEYLGRIDSQIKLRGFRIELGEIEALLNQHPAVNEAVVILYEADDNKRLLAYFTETGQGGEMLTTAVRSWLKARLPDYMIPAQFIVLDKLPVTTNGKINRKALPAPELNLLDVYEAPRNPIEQQLADIWSVLFKRDPIGIRDNFFSLGGNSILSMQMVVNAQQAGLQFTPRDLFEQQTIAELASVLSETQVRELGPTPRTDNANIPLSFGQHRLWLKQIAHPNHSTFNISDCFRLTGKLNKTALQQSFAEIIRRHEILHTVFPVQNGMPVQSIIATAPVTISLKELQGLPENAQLNAVRQWAMTKIACHFDLVNGPLLSINLMQLAEESHILLLCFHHIIMDFMSIGILLNELTSIYTAIVSSKPSPLSDLPIQFADYALWQQRVLTPEALDTKLNYWRTWLAKGEPPVLPLPTDRNRLKAGSLEADIAFYQLSPELLTELKRLSQRTGVTLYSVFLSALSVLLHSYSACEDMVVSSPVANRNHSSLEPLIGLMGSLLLLRIDLSGKPRITELLTEVQQVVLAAIANQDPPFEEVVKILQPERKRDTPLFRVLINFLPESPQKQFTLPDLTISSLPLDESEMNMDLVLAFWEEDRRLCGWWRYRKDIFDAKTIVRINKDFQTVLEAMVTAPEQRVDHLALNLKN
jgi:amino acid adenylation domain-containing protein